MSGAGYLDGRCTDGLLLSCRLPALTLVFSFTWPAINAPYNPLWTGGTVTEGGTGPGHTISTAYTAPSYLDPVYFVYLVIKKNLPTKI